MHDEIDDLRTTIRKMEDILRQWQAADEASDDVELASASEARDELLNELDGWE